MKEGLTVCISLFIEDHWKISRWLWVFSLWSCCWSFIWSNLYLSLSHFVESPLMSTFTSWVRWVSSWLHACWFNTFRSDLKRSESIDFLFQFANYYSYKQLLREAKRFFFFHLFEFFLSSFLFFLFALSLKLLACIGCRIYIQKIP